MKASRDRDVQIGTNGKILPQTLLDLGQKKIYPRKALAPMTNCRKTVERACLAHGTRFMGGYAIPDEHVDEAVEKIKEVQKAYEGHVSRFMREFDQKREDWLSEPEQAPHRAELEDCVPSKEAVRNRFRFDWQVVKLQPIEGQEPYEKDIANQILHELALDCKAMANALLERKTAVSGGQLRKQLNPFIERLNALSFGNSRILTVLGEFRALHDSVPLERITKDHPKFGQTLTFLKMGSDSDTLEQIIDGSFSVAGLINSMTRQQAIPEPSAQGEATPASAPAFAPIVKPAAGAYF